MLSKSLSFKVSSDPEQLQKVIRICLEDLEINYEINEENIFKVSCLWSYYTRNLEAITDEIINGRNVDNVTKLNFQIVKVNNTLSSLCEKIPFVGGLFKKSKEIGEKITNNAYDIFGANHIGEIAITLSAIDEKTNVEFSTNDDINNSVLYSYYFIIRKEILKFNRLDISDFPCIGIVEEEQKNNSVIKINDKDEIPPNIMGYVAKENIDITQKVTPNNNVGNKNENQVFISYNHKDRLVANRVRECLEKANIEVVIDSKNMKAGEDIESFINNSISQANITLSIVSTNSLLSSWVSMESTLSVSAEKVTNKKFIAAYIDSDFFNIDFVDTALNRIESNTDEIEELIAKRLQKDRNIDDLYSELSRYKNLEYYLPKIISKLKSNLTVDITERNFDRGILKIIDTIRA